MYPTESSISALRAQQLAAFFNCRGLKASTPLLNSDQAHARPWEQAMTQQDAVFEHVNESVMTRTMDGIIDFWNQSAEKLYGWTKEDAIGKVSHHLLQTQFPKPLEEIESELVRTGRWEGKLVHTTRNGAQVVVQSRWVLDLDGQSKMVVEINARSSDGGIDREGLMEFPTESKTGRQDPVRSRETRAEDILLKIANVVLFTGGIVCLLVLFYLIYHYSWTGDRQFVSYTGMLLYYGLPGLLAAVLFTSLRLSPSFRGKLALVLLSTCISLYAVELVLTFLNPETFGIKRSLWFPPHTKRELTEIVDVAKKFGVDFDTRSKLQIILELRQRGIRAVPAVVPGGLLRPDADGALTSEITMNGTEALPLGGISNRVTVLCNESGKYEIYESDERGFHNPEAIWNSGRFDVAAVGDSYTHGYCVPSEKNFVALIRQHYPVTLNLGMAGDGPLMELATLKEYVQFAKPRIVLWFFWEGNDLIDLEKERRSPLLMRYLEGNFNQVLVHRQPEIDTALAAYVEKARKELDQDPANLPEGKDETAMNAQRLLGISEAVFKLSNVRQRLGLIYAANDGTADKRAVSEDEMKLFGKILLQAKAVVSEWGGTLYFVYLPELDRYVDPRIAALSEKDRQQVLRIAKSAGLAVIDINDVFQAHADPLSLFPFRRLGHYNEDGHRLVAEAVLKSIALPN
jgi:PAS domain S-box-containing protein